MNESQLSCLIKYKVLVLTPDLLHPKLLEWIIDDDGLHYIFKSYWNIANNKVKKVKLIFQFTHQMLNVLNH